MKYTTNGCAVQRDGGLFCILRSEADATQVADKLNAGIKERPYTVRGGFVVREFGPAIAEGRTPEGSQRIVDELNALASVIAIQTKESRTLEGQKL